MFIIDNGDLKKLADKVIAEHNDMFEYLSGCNIAFMVSDKPKASKGKKVYADTEKVKDKYKLLTDVDFIITYYADTEDISETAREILMLHELMHIGYDVEQEKYYIVPHDFEDFLYIVNEYGIDWIDIA